MALTLLKFPLQLLLFLLLLLGNALLLIDLFLVGGHVSFDFIHEPILVILVKLWLLHLCIGTGKQAFSILSLIESSSPRLRHIIFPTVLGTQRLFLHHAEIAVLRQNRVCQVILNFKWPTSCKTFVELHLVLTASQLFDGDSNFEIALSLSLSQRGSYFRLRLILV